jgi:hypothetical protein
MEKKRKGVILLGKLKLGQVYIPYSNKDTEHACIHMHDASMHGSIMSSHQHDTSSKGVLRLFPGRGAPMAPAAQTAHTIHTRTGHGLRDQITHGNRLLSRVCSVMHGAS